MLFISVLNRSSQSNNSSSNVRMWAISSISASPCLFPGFPFLVLPDRPTRPAKVTCKAEFPRSLSPAWRTSPPFCSRTAPAARPACLPLGRRRRTVEARRCLERAWRRRWERCASASSRRPPWPPAQVKGRVSSGPDVPSPTVSDFKCLLVCMSITASIAPLTIPVRRDPPHSVPLLKMSSCSLR